MKSQTVNRFAKTCKTLSNAAQEQQGAAWLDSNEQGWRLNAPAGMLWKAADCNAMIVSFDATDVEINEAIERVREGVIEEIQT